MTPSPSDSGSLQELLQPVLYGLQRRQRAVLVVAGLVVFVGLLVGVADLFFPASESGNQAVVGWLAFGFIAFGVAIAILALTRLDPRKARVYLLLKHKPEAIATVYFDVKHFRGYPYEYVVLQTSAPRRNYVVSGIQRFGIPATLHALRQVCPEARFSCSPVVKQKYFPEPE